MEKEIEGRFRFRLGRRDQLVLYKQRGESLAQIRLRAIAYALYFRECEHLQIGTRLDYKVQPDLVSLDLEGKPTVWIQCHVTRDVGDLDYVCKHVPAREVVLISAESSTEDLADWLRRRIHYRYVADKLKIINFRTPIDDWFDPENLDIPVDAYDIVDF